MRIRKWTTKSMVATMATILLVVPALRASADLTAAQVLDRSKNAYASLKSYKGTSKVVTNSTIGGMKQTFNTSAVIEFVRPGRIRVEGTLMMSGNYTIVSDGTHTWQTTIGGTSKWEAAQSTEMAIASFTGVSMQAATTIPAILTNSNWGLTFGSGTPGKMSTEVVNGHPAYRVEIKSPMGDRTVWIDRKSYLLLQKQDRTDLSQMKLPAGANLPQGAVPTGKMQSTETFIGIHVNVSIPASRFARPTNAPK